MASISDDDNIVPEETGRRTRSGRTLNAPALPSTPRSTRRTRKTTQEQEHEQAMEHELIVIHEADIQEETTEHDNEQDIMQTEIEVNNDTEQNQNDEKSSPYTFEELPSDITLLYEQSSADKEEINNIPNPNSRDSIDNLFFANLAAEDNANSLPSGIDENEVSEVELHDHFGDQESLKKSEDDKSRDKRIEIAQDNSEMMVQMSDENNIEENSVSSNNDNAIAEDLPNGQDSRDSKGDLDAEMVSEDELPAPLQPKVQDAEEVSDDELPGPKLAELPADTEVVSEDELPASSKKESAKRKIDEGYDPGSPTESTEGPEKKSKVESDTEKESEVEKKKELPELDKYWKAVNDDPADFTAWTYLLQYVDQENDIEAARESYDAFLAHYPYCYGYWRKYADYEKKKGNKAKCEEVFERGLKAIPLSVDLWIHYLTHVKTNYNDDENNIRSQFERALNACGLEFRSDKLWEAYIKWETEGKRIINIVQIYDRLLATPTQGYNGHFDSFQEVVNNNPVQSLISIEEFKKLRKEVRDKIVDAVDPEELDQKIDSDAKIENSEKSDVEIKENIEETTIVATEKDAEEEKETPTESATSMNDEIVSTIDQDDEPDDAIKNEEEGQAIKDKILSIRKKIHKLTIAAVTARWTYEEGIKRPYFHVKPLERCQLKNWKEYLDYEIEQGDRKRILVLFERCLIACALYDEFWIKLIRYLELQYDNIIDETDTENKEELLSKTRDVYDRACTVHHPDKPSLHLLWSAFEECNNNFDKAADILTNLEKICPNILQVAYRRINLERRRNDYNKCIEFYDYYISSSKNKSISSSLSIKYARFLNKIYNNIDMAITILKTALEKDPTNTRVALQMIDLALQRSNVDENEVIEIMDNFMNRECIELEQKILFAQRKVEFLEDFGSKAKGLQEAQRLLQVLLTKANENKKKSSEASPPKKTSSKESANPPLPVSTSSANYNSSYNFNSGQGTAAASGYYGGSGTPSAGYQSYTGSSGGSGDNNNYGYGQWGQYAQSGYSGYGQWSGYGNYY